MKINTAALPAELQYLHAALKFVQKTLSRVDKSEEEHRSS